MTPKIIFIIPYRDRVEHKQFFTVYIKYLLEDYDPTDYEIYFSHQCDNRTFNRGAVKNIGFLAMKTKYPDHYKNITFVFHDVDSIPYKKNLLPYETTNGVIKHFYGFKYCLGGIFSIKGEDFERINGFPNLWAWSQEDNLIYKRAIRSGLKIDRNVFFPINSPCVLQFTDGLFRKINRNELANALDDNYPYGLNSIRNLTTSIKDEYININTFSCEREDVKSHMESYNIKNGSKIRVKDNRFNMRYIGRGK
jgi:hypothetical protein